MKVIDAIGKIMVNLDEVTSSNLTTNAGEYKYKIYPLIDTIQREIATIVKPIKKYLTVDCLNLQIDLPADCFEFLRIYNTDLSPVNYKIINGIIYVDYDETYTLCYNKYPDTIDVDSPDETELEIDKDCQEALIYGVCAGICINDEPELYDTYSDRYNTMLANITSRMQNNSTARLVGGLRL